MINENQIMTGIIVALMIIVFITLSSATYWNLKYLHAIENGSTKNLIIYVKEGAKNE